MTASDANVRDLELLRVETEPFHKALGSPAGAVRQVVERVGLLALRSLAFLRGAALAEQFVSETGRRDAELVGGPVDPDLQDASLDCVQVEVAIGAGFLSGYRTLRVGLTK